MSEKKKRIGIMGGTFDPINIGHLILGETAYHQFHLDKVLFMRENKSIAIYQNIDNRLICYKML